MNKEYLYVYCGSYKRKKLDTFGEKHFRIKKHCMNNFFPPTKLYQLCDRRDCWVAFRTLGVLFRGLCDRVVINEPFRESL